MLIDEEVQQSMQIESIVESVKIDEVTVTVDPIAVDKNYKDRMTRAGWQAIAVLISDTTREND